MRRILRAVYGYGLLGIVYSTLGLGLTEPRVKLRSDTWRTRVAPW